MDIYVKKFCPDASQRRINYVGRIVTVVGASLAIILTVAIDSIKGLNLFNVFQSVLGFIAPPMTAVFLMGIFWQKTTTRAANFALTIGTAFCLIVGVLYLWPPEWLTFQWPHFMMLSFWLFVILIACMAVISLCDKQGERYAIPEPIHEEHSKLVIALWVVLFIVMIGLYIYFN